MPPVIVGNAGVALDGAAGSAIPSNALVVAGSDGVDIRALSTDASGNLNSNASSVGTSNTTAATWTIATAQNATVTLLSANFKYNSLVVTFNASAGLGGGQIVIEASNDNSNWLILVGSAIPANTGSGQALYNGTIIPNSGYSAAQFNISPWQYVRARLSVAFGGVSTLVIGYAAQTQGTLQNNLIPQLVNILGGGNIQALMGANPGTNNGGDGVGAPAGMVDYGGNGRTLLVSPVLYSGSTWNGTRTPNIFKTASVSATASGNTAVWTPTSGKKFRLMRFQITATNLTATAATVITVSFQDSTTGINIGTYDVLLPAAATATDLLLGGTQQISAWVDLGNGFLSASANNVLNANVSATVTGATGTFRYNVCGTEE